MIEQDDARLTAYVVDEVDPETAAAIEEALQESAALRDQAEEIRAAAALVTEALRREPAPALLSEQRAALTRPSPSRRAAFAVTHRAAVWAGLAASVVAATAAIALWRGSSRDAQPLAVASTPTVPLTSTSPVPPALTADPRPAAARPAAPQRRAPSATVASTPALTAAASTVTIRGVVKDSSGAPIPGATITAHSLDDGLTVTATSDSRGEFRVQDQLAGRVVLSAGLPGFRSAQQEIAVSPARAASWEPTLEVGALTETVTVTASTPLAHMSIGVGPSLEGRPDAAFNTASYAYRADSSFVDVRHHPLSTFAADVDTASYANVRRFLNDDELPPADAVRIEEMLNYFPYDYTAPRQEPFAAHLELGPAPWKPAHRLLRIGLKAREIAVQHRPASNLVFLVDVSGSMNAPNRLPLVKRALEMLVESLDGRDRIAIVVYAGAAGLVLPPTSGADKATILGALARLQAGGSTNGAQGIQLAYDTAAGGFLSHGNNRVILATDGDFNVGMTDEGSLTRLIQERAKGGVFLSVLGFGMDNYKDSTLEMLADKGNGNYAYVDTDNEARKTLVDQLTSTLITVAKDVKIQVEFNPSRVRSYRLLGYENRLLRPEDFRDDTKDAGEVGAGHAVTALYEIVPASEDSSPALPDRLRYQERGGLTGAARGGELMRMKLRYKDPKGSRSRSLEWTAKDEPVPLSEASADFRFAAAVAAFGMLLRDSPHKGAATFDDVRAQAEAAKGQDAGGYRQEFIHLVGKAQGLRQAEDAPPEGR